MFETCYPSTLPCQRKSAFVLAPNRRREAERRLTKPMLYVKGWPTRMLSDGEADLLAEVRSEVSAMLGFRACYRDRPSIHARYAELLDMHASRGRAA